MRLLALAWRNVLRHKRRTLTSLSALVVGLTGLVVFQGYLVQTMKGFKEQTILSGIGQLQVAAADGYFSDGEFSPYAYPLGGQDEAMNSLQAVPGVTAVFPSTGFTAIAGSESKAATLLVKAYPSDRMSFGERKPCRFQLGPLVAGTWEEAGPPSRIVLGETAARILHTDVGSTVTLMIILPEGGLDARDFTVAAIYRSPGRDKIFAFVDFDTAQAFTQMSAPPVLHVLTTAETDPQTVARAVPSGLTYRSFDQLAPFYVQVNGMFEGFLAVIRTILLLVTLFILANTMNRTVLERMREWGTLRALGTKARSILALIILEGGLQGFLGAILGIVAGFVVSLAVNLAGGIPYVNGDEVFQIRVSPDLTTIWWNLVPVVATAALAAILPAFKAIAVQPSEALRSV